MKTRLIPPTENLVKNKWVPTVFYLRDAPFKGIAINISKHSELQHNEITNYTLIYLPIQELVLLKINDTNNIIRFDINNLTDVLTLEKQLTGINSTLPTSTVSYLQSLHEAPPVKVELDQAKSIDKTIPNIIIVDD
jgi:hypothetical protein